MKPHTLKFFINRIGKKVYRDKVSCTCNHCEFNEKNGILISDRQQAQYLYDVQNDMHIIYRDKK